MHESQDNDNATERGSSLSVAQGLLCPFCKRPFCAGDFYPHRSNYSVICWDCGTTLIAYRE